MATNNPHDPELRAAIIKELNEAKGEWGYRTWWFKFHIPFETTEVQQELERMELDGLVMADRRQSINAKWVLVRT